MRISTPYGNQSHTGSEVVNVGMYTRTLIPANFYPIPYRTYLRTRLEILLLLLFNIVY